MIIFFAHIKQLFCTYFHSLIYSFTHLYKLMNLLLFNVFCAEDAIVRDRQKDKA